MSREFFGKKVLTVEDAEKQLKEMVERNNRIPGFREQYGYPKQLSLGQENSLKQTVMKRT